MAVSAVRSKTPVHCTSPCASFTHHQRCISHLRCVRDSRLRALGGEVASLAELIGAESILPELGMTPEVAVLASAGFATVSLLVNFWGGVATENKRAELQLELERDKRSQQQLSEVRGVIARYRGPLLESAIDLEQRLWHLVADQCSATDCVEDIRYLMYTLAQFLGFVEVVRREGPRERHFLQAGSPQGSDTLSTLLEGMRFMLCASPDHLEKWYHEGSSRTHPGARRRRPREEIIAENLAAAASSQGASAAGNGRAAAPAAGDLLRLSRGAQRAIGSYMVGSPMGAERHYTLTYTEFHTRMEDDAAGFRQWFLQVESDALQLATGAPWQGEGPFPVGEWTRVLLLQQLLVELMDLLDPDCVRLPLERRTRLMPIAWGPLPNIAQYRAQLQVLSQASDYGRVQLLPQQDAASAAVATVAAAAAAAEAEAADSASLEGIRHLLATRSFDASGEDGSELVAAAARRRSQEQQQAGWGGSGEQ